MAWPWEIVERDHDIQNPTSPEKIRLLGAHLRLTREKPRPRRRLREAGPALLLASTDGCQIVGIEKRTAFAVEARARIAAHGLAHLAAMAAS